MKGSTAINQANTQGHAALFYDTPQERLKLLVKYYQEGLEKNELCVLVTADPVSQVLQNFKSLAFDATEAVGTGALRIFSMDETYLPDGRFAADFMLRNVQNYIAEAHNLGYGGLRTAGEMTWLYNHANAIPEAIKYEGGVNSLGNDNPNFIGLCLYPIQDNFHEIFGSALRTHPAFIYDGHTRPSPYYIVR